MKLPDHLNDMSGGTRVLLLAPTMETMSSNNPTWSTTSSQRPDLQVHLTGVHPGACRECQPGDGYNAERLRLDPRFRRDTQTCRRQWNGDIVTPIPQKRLASFRGDAAVVRCTLNRFKSINGLRIAYPEETQCLKSCQNRHLLTDPVHRHSSTPSKY